jgi:hypothetical protein
MRISVRSGGFRWGSGEMASPLAMTPRRCAPRLSVISVCTRARRYTAG